MQAWKGVIAAAAIVVVGGAVAGRADAAATTGSVIATVGQVATLATGALRSDQSQTEARFGGRTGIVKIRGLRGRGFSRGVKRRGMVFRGRSFPGERFTYESATRGMGTRTYRFRRGDKTRSLSRGDNARSVFDRRSEFRRETGMGGPTVGTFGLRRGLDGRLRLRKGFGRGIGFKTR